LDVQLSNTRKKPWLLNDIKIQDRSTRFSEVAFVTGTLRWRKAKELPLQAMSEGGRMAGFQRKPGER
jgi:hypothetical protein